LFDNGIQTATSLTIPKSSSNIPNLSHEDFFIMLEQEMKKIEFFTNSQVQQSRAALVTLEKDIQEKLMPMDDDKDSHFQALTEEYNQTLKRLGDDFLNLEKYVNINFTGFHKILKKHDKYLPNPCRTFYTKRLQNQSWIRGDYSDVFVTMSRLYALLRRDKKAEVKDDAKQVSPYELDLF
jgi:SPX domain protein involved in polyphosphate accumulation